MAEMLPRELYSAPIPAGMQALRERVIELVPANATGSTKYGALNNRILFNIPSYPNSFISTRRSFMSFKGKVSVSATTDLASFKDGVPVFERLVVRGGNGALLEDIRGYESIERVMSNLDDWQHKWADAHEVGDYRAITDQETTPVFKDALFKGTAGKYNATDGLSSEKVYRKPIISGIFGQDQETALPVGLMSASGGFAFQLEFYLNEDAVAVEAGSYELDEVKMTLHLLEVPQDMYARMNEKVMAGEDFVLPFKRLQQHRHFLPQNNQKFNINIHESARNVEAVYAVMREQSKGATTLAFNGGAQPPASTSGDNVGPKVQMYQFRYAQHYFPAQAVEIATEKDSTLALSHALASMDMLEAGQPLLSTYKRTGAHRWESEDFFIGQSFKTTKDNRLNGLNSLSSGAPLQLDLTLRAPLNDGQELLAYIVEDQQMRISKGGMIRLVE